MIKKITVGIAVVICLIIGVVGCAFAYIMTPEFLTPHVERMLQQYSKSKVSVKSVDLSLFARFPNVTLRIDSLQIKQTKDSISDLIFARECRLAVDPKALLRDELSVRYASIRGASIYLYVDSLTSPIGTFILPEVADVEAVDSLDTFDLSRYKLNLRKFKIDSTQLVIDDRNKRFYTRVENYNLETSMDVSAMRTDLDVVTGFGNLIVWRDGDLLVKKTSMEFRSKMVHDRETHILSYDKARIKINGIDLKSHGKFVRDTIPGGVNVDIRASLNTPSLTEFLALVPPSVLETKDQIETEGEVKLDVELKGLYSSTSTPTIGANLKIDNAKAKYQSRRLALERVDCDAYMFVDLNNPESAYADVKSLHINTSGIIDLNMSGKVTNAVENPEVDGQVDAYLNFDRFSELFPLKEAVTLGGENNSTIKTRFKLSDLKAQNYADIFINGESNFTKLKLALDSSKFLQDTTALSHLNVEAEKGTILFGDNLIVATNSRTLRAQADFSNLSYKSKVGEFADVRDLRVVMGANFDRKSSKVNGLGVRCVAKNSDVGIDSLFKANIQSSDASYIIKPRNESHETQIDAKINTQQITVTEPLYGSMITLSTADITLNLEREKEGVTDRKWNKVGNVAFTEFGLESKVFSLPISIPETSITMNNSGIALNNAHMRIGDTDIVATGFISNLLTKLFVDPRELISGNLKIDAPKLDVGELIEASNRTVLMFEETTTDEVPVSSVPTLATTPLTPAAPQKRDSLLIGRVDSLARQSVDTTMMFLVPRRVNFVFDLNVDKAIIWDAKVENMRGRATIDKGTLRLDSLRLKTIGADALANIVYRNTSRSSANVSADISLSKVDINRIGELMPQMDAMFPMLESLEGIVDFDLKLNTNLVGDSEVDFNTLYSAARFYGRNLVLLDSETFTDISKTLKFKNRDRNLIDSLELFALIEETKVDLLPFSLTMDRYTAYISGSQVIDPVSFDVDYNYHISIIKSPLPFKAGVDINGNLDDYKFKITKAKLKKTNFEEQRKIYEEYRKSINDAESELETLLNKRRSEMRARREEQRKKQEQHEREAQSVEAEPVETIVESEAAAE